MFFMYAIEKWASPFLGHVLPVQIKNNAQTIRFFKMANAEFYIRLFRMYKYVFRQLSEFLFFQYIWIHDFIRTELNIRVAMWPERAEGFNNHFTAIAQIKLLKVDQSIVSNHH